MRRGKTGTICAALAVTLCLLAAAARMDVAYGAIGIETTKKDCSITFDLSLNVAQTGSAATPSVPGGGNVATSSTPGGGNAAASLAAFKELETLKIPVRLYKVADVAVDGKFVKPAAGDASLFQALEQELKGVNSTTTAAQWLAMAETARNTAEEENTAAFTNTTLNDPHSGAGYTIDGLPTGLYLVDAQEVKSEEYIYSFTPYLVSVPGNAFYENGNDDWIYDVEVGLKPGRENRYGNLEIIKTLDEYNATLGGATFVFQIEMEEKDGIKYSDVVSIVFDGPGTKAVQILQKIPAGAKVTVTEVYSGASYVVTGSGSVQTIEVVKAQDPLEPGSAQTPEFDRVSFSNTYNDEPKGGSSIVNHFEYTAPEEPGTPGGDGTGGAGTSTDSNAPGGTQNAGGTWSFEQQTDSTGSGVN